MIIVRGLDPCCGIFDNTPHLPGSHASLLVLPLPLDHDEALIDVNCDDSTNTLDVADVEGVIGSKLNQRRSKGKILGREAFKEIKLR